jgi:hypothetical protein
MRFRREIWWNSMWSEYKVWIHVELYAPDTIAVKWSGFTVWRHTWRKNWANCAVLTGNNAGLRTTFTVVFHTENCAVHLGNPTVSSVSCRHHDAIISRHSIHPSVEHRMIYSFTNTTFYSIFYAFFSSFRITLWPMWLANSKRQPCFYPP